MKKVLTQEASSENSSERRPTESQPPLTSHTHSTSQAEGMQNENMAADFKSEDKNKDQEFEIQERVSIESLELKILQVGMLSQCTVIPSGGIFSLHRTTSIVSCSCISFF